MLNEYHIIPYHKDDALDVRECPSDILSEEIHKYLYQKTFLHACQYCDGQHIYSKIIKKSS